MPSPVLAQVASQSRSATAFGRVIPDPDRDNGRVWVGRHVEHGVLVYPIPDRRGRRVRIVAFKGDGGVVRLSREHAANFANWSDVTAAEAEEVAYRLSARAGAAAFGIQLRERGAPRLPARESCDVTSCRLFIKPGAAICPGCGATICPADHCCCPG